MAKYNATLPAPITANNHLLFHRGAQVLRDIFKAFLTSYRAEILSYMRYFSVRFENVLIEKASMRTACFGDLFGAGIFGRIHGGYIKREPPKHECPWRIIPFSPSPSAVVTLKNDNAMFHLLYTDEERKPAYPLKI